MKCRECGTEMVEGQAIDCGYREYERGIMEFTPIFNHETIKLICCLKCPACGHSDDEQNSVRTLKWNSNDNYYENTTQMGQMSIFQRSGLT